MAETKSQGLRSERADETIPEIFCSTVQLLNVRRYKILFVWVRRIIAYPALPKGFETRKTLSQDIATGPEIPQRIFWGRRFVEGMNFPIVT
jgi:hypothetical protein